MNELNALAADLKPEVIAITETWTNSSICDSYINIPGYKLIVRKDRSDTLGGRGGGILLYIKSNIACHEINVPENLIQVAAARINSNKKNLDIHVIYRSPNSSPENNTNINNYIRSINENSIIVGDFNYPHINWELMSGNSHATDFIESVSEKFLTQHVTFPTHNGGNTLDLVLSNIPNRVESVTDCGKLGNSDHVIISTVVKFVITTNVPSHTVWDFKKANFDEMKAEIAKTSWKEILVNDVESDWDEFKNRFTHLCHKFVPKKSVKEMKRPPWLKQENIRLIRQKRVAWKNYKNKKEADSEKKFKALQKKVKKAVKNAKHKYESQIAKCAKTNPKLFYSYLNKKKTNKVNVGPIRREDGSLCHDDKEMTEILNKHYASVFTKEDPHLPDKQPPCESPKMEDVKFNPSVIAEILKHMKNSSSPGPDEISQRIIKEVADEVSLPLSILYSKSIKSGQLPGDWKKANVVPVFKKGSKGEPINYRPISLTSVVVKVMERIIKERMMKHLSINNLLRPSQHGFMPKKSTTTNLVTYMNYVTKKIDDGLPVDVLYVDFAKAFDKVPHKRLIQKLNRYQFSQELMIWIEAWLADRKQRVQVNGKYSKWLDVTSSVVQGSVLGPLLFILFIDDIDSCLGNYSGLISKFADDTKIAKVVKDSASASEMQTVIKNLEIWCKTWEMELNAKKCSIMHFGHGNMKKEYFINGEKLCSPQNQKDLGVTISNSCTPGVQCALAAKKANQVLGQINRSFTCYTHEIMTQIYKVFVRSHLEYAVAAWSPWHQKDIDVLEKIQRRATRRMSDIQGTYPERLKKLNLTTLEERRLRGDAIEMFKCLKGFYDVEKEKLFTINEVDQPKTRHQKSHMPLNVPRSKLDLRKNSFCVRGPTLWNSLPSNVRDSSSVNAFKNAYDKHVKTL